MGELTKAPPKVQMLPSENERDRVLTREEEDQYLAAAVQVGTRNVHQRYCCSTC